jgi:OOP family OmpA-OmpF porin
LQKDTDGDGLTDREEVLKYKTNPLSAMSKPAIKARIAGLQKEKEKKKGKVNKKKEKLLAIVYFDYRSSNLSQKARRTLRDICRALKGNETLIIKGYADWKGSKSFNLKLSERRAKKVKSYLNRSCRKYKKKIRFRTEWFGYEKLVIEQKGPLSPNRRVEIYVLE